MRLLRELWPWIVLPMILMLAALALLVFLSGGEQSGSQFVYPIF